MLHLTEEDKMHANLLKRMTFHCAGCHHAVAIHDDELLDSEDILWCFRCGARLGSYTSIKEQQRPAKN
ncbi:hypothetical protein YH62_15105 [Rhizobium sp. LC145]|nr:hypothetical protein YH62_15105 [Rhizobium sp. LC145]